MATIAEITNNESGASVRTKLNEMRVIVNAADVNAGRIPQETDVADIASGSTHTVDMSTTGAYLVSPAAAATTLTLAYTLGADAATYKQTKDIEIDNSANTAACNFTFSGTWDWVGNVEPSGIAIGARAILTLETNKTKVLASYNVLA